MTNMDDIMARMDAARAKQAEARIKTRADLLAELRAIGTTQILARYNGYGDEGNVQDVCAEPDTNALSSDILNKLTEFAWDLAYSLNPGFENNEGGNGELTWIIATDTINVSHNDCYVEYDTAEHEDV